MDSVAPGSQRPHPTSDPHALPTYARLYLRSFDIRRENPMAFAICDASNHRRQDRSHSNDQEEVLEEQGQFLSVLSITLAFMEQHLEKTLKLNLSWQ